VRAAFGVYALGMRNPSLCRSGLTALLLSFVLALPGFAYDYPLTPSAIRDAYFLGTRQAASSPDFLKQYSRRIAELHQGTCTSEVRIETPFLQIVEYVGSMPNYSSQNAVKEFYDHPMPLRIFLNICYMREAPPPNSIKTKFIQNKKEILPVTDLRSAYAEPLNEYGNLPPNGERAKLEFDAKKLDSSTLTILIDTPDGQHTETEFDLQSLR
jgi:hypothetical protein